MTGLSWRFHHRAGSLGKALLFCLLPAIAAAFLFLGTAKAQEEPEYGHVDLVMLYEHQRGLHPQVLYSVRNVGTTAATGVSVSFLLEDLEAGTFEFFGTSILPAITGKKTVDTTNQEFTWVVGTIPPGGASEKLEFATKLHSGRTTADRIGVINAEASSNQPEPDNQLANNKVKVYSYTTSRTGLSLHMRRNWLGLLLSVDNRQPAPGDAVDFSLTAINNQSGSSHAINLIADAKVKVELSDGLEFKTGWDPTTIDKSGSQSATWSPPDTAGESDSIPSSQVIEIETQLTTDSLDDIPLADRCITARVTDSIPPPSPSYVWGSLKQCLGDDPKVLLKDGEIDLLYLHPCATASAITYPCRDADGNSAPDNGLELVIHAFLIDQTILRRIGLARSDYRGMSLSHDYILLRPENVVVQVDPRTRVGTKWYTGSDENTDTDDAGIIPGVVAHLDFLGADWKPYTLAISDVSPKKRPGSMAILNMTNTSFTILDADTKKSLGPINSDVDVIPIIGAFETLGTYVVNITITGTHSSTGYPSTGRYTFHVGPIAELEVQGGGRSPTVPAGQRAFTIVAVNNGLDDAPAAQVTLTGLNAGDYVSHTATAGSFDSTTGVWTVGELKNKDYYQAVYGRDEEVLTIITSAAVDTEITAAISNTQDYQVCIDSGGGDVDAANEAACTGTSGNTWHTTEYYDYISDNDSATIRAKEGTGADLPVIQSVEAVGPAAIKITWGEITEVNGHRVTHYEVERETNPRATVADDVTGTSYVDTEVEAGQNPRYRVRAVNEFGQEGPWSLPSGGRPGAPGDFNAEVGSGQITLSWSAPQGVTVTGYNLDYSTDGGDTWTSLAPPATLGQSATSYNHTGLTLTPGATWHYRLRAVGDGFTSDWEETSVTVPYPKPGVPVNFAAEGESETQAELSWTAPTAVTNVAVTGYELGFSTDGGGSWDPLTDTSTLSGTTRTMTHSDNTLGADAVRQYRARTTGTVGSVTVESAWVYALATENYPSPGAPRAFTARAINQSQVDLSWSAPLAVSGVNITGYDLDFSQDGNMWESLAQGRTQTNFEHIDEDLAAGALRQYRLRAVGTANNAVFRSGWVFASAATEEVGAPQNLAATADGRNRIDLSWDQPGFGEGGVTGYRIDYAPGSSEAWQTLEHGYRISPRRYEHGGLLPGDRYCYRVAAIYAGGTGPFAARACATTEGAPEDLPGEPENLRVAQVGSNYVVLEWDPPSVGGPVEYYQWRSNIHQPGEVTPRTATSVRVGGLPPGSTYSFQVRAGNSYGPGGWSTSIPVTLHRAVSAVKASPDELEVGKGGSGSFNVSLNRSPQWPLSLYLIWEGPDCLTESLPYQQGKILLPTNPPPSKEFWDDFWWGPPEDRFAVPWNTGLDIRIDASGCQGGETAVVNYDLWSLPFSYLEGMPMWEELNLNQEEWREKWGVDPLDGVSGPSVKVTVEDGGDIGGQQSSPGAAGQPTAVTLALDAATVSESAGEATVTATLDAPAPEGGMGGFLLAGEDGTASEDIDFTMPLSIFIPGGQRSATATISITDDDWDEADETVVMSALFDIGTALLEDKITLTITDDDTAGVTVSAASGLSVSEGDSTTYTVVLDSQPTADVTVSASSGDGAKVSVSPGTNTFTPSAWNTPLTFTVNGLADTDTNDESVGISHWITSDDWKYAVFPVSTVPVAVSDTTPEQQHGTPNQAPTVASAIGDATIVNESAALEVSLTGVFSDADNDALTITAGSGNEGVAAVSVATGYSTLTVRAKSSGTATITVTASDGNGGTVEDSFTVKVKAAPVVASAIADLDLEVGGTQDISLSGVFSDAVGDALTITADTSDEAKATATVAADHSGLTVEGVAEGAVTITVTAQDSDGNRVSDAFEVAVEPEPEQDPPQDEETPNRPPTVAQALPDISLEGLQWRQFSLPGVFHDPDGDELTFTGVSSDYGVATAWVVGSILTVVAAGTGTATITVTAEDPEGNRVSDAFQVTVTPAS